jgi:hypothetical protein
LPLPSLDLARLSLSSPESTACSYKPLQRVAGKGNLQFLQGSFAVSIHLNWKTGFSVPIFTRE